MKQIGIGLIGTGFMGRTYSLSYTVMPFCKWPVRLMPRKVVIAGIVEDLAADAAARFGYEKYTTSWKDVIDDPDVDLVDIVVPNDWHHPAEPAVLLGKGPGSRTGIPYDYYRSAAYLR